jgi:hypothetical protein
MKTWVNSKEIPKLEWRRFKSGKIAYSFVFKNFIGFGEEVYIDTNYLIFNVVADEDYPEIGVFKNCEYTLSIPELTFSEGWKLHSRRPELKERENLDLRIIFSRKTKKTMLIHSISPASIPEVEMTL